MPPILGTIAASWRSDGTLAVINLGTNNSDAAVSTVTKILINTAGTASDWGNLTQARRICACVGSTTRAVWAGGNTTSSVNTMDYMTMASGGSATSFGTLATDRKEAAGINNTTRGVICCGYNTTSINGTLNSLEYITIATTGNATSFGTLASGSTANVGTVSSPTRGVIYGGYNGGTDMWYITTATTGNAATFGQKPSGGQSSGVSNGTRGVFNGTSASSRLPLEYITIATTGNSTTFGNLSVGRYYAAGVSNAIYGIWAYGSDGASYLSSSEYITIATTGNAASFGDLGTIAHGSQGTSVSNGGLQ